MPAKSKAQRRCASIALDMKKRGLKRPSPKAPECAKKMFKMKIKDLEDFAKTPEKNLPDYVEEILIKKVVSKILKEAKNNYIKIKDISIKNYILNYLLSETFLIVYQNEIIQNDIIKDELEKVSDCISNIDEYGNTIVGCLKKDEAVYVNVLDLYYEFNDYKEKLITFVYKIIKKYNLNNRDWNENNYYKDENLKKAEQEIENYHKELEKTILFSEKTLYNLCDRIEKEAEEL